MTTIAYRDGVLASDSQAIIDCILPYVAKKLHRLTSGGVAGACGERQEIMPFIEWLNSGRAGKRPKLTNSTVIEMQPGGLPLIIHETVGQFEQDCTFMAWGSGGPLAIAAMWAGADAMQAIEIAAKMDQGTGGPVCFMRCTA